MPPPKNKNDCTHFRQNELSKDICPSPCWNMQTHVKTYIGESGLDMEHDVQWSIQQAKVLIITDVWMTFYSKREPLYLEMDKSGVGSETGLLWVRQGMNCPRNEVPNNVALLSIAFASKGYPVQKPDIVILRGRCTPYSRDEWRFIIFVSPIESTQLQITNYWQLSLERI